MNISEKERMKILGDLGEKIYANHCSSLGHKIHLSLNPFDMEKDILVDDKRKEIKNKLIKTLTNFRGRIGSLPSAKRRPGTKGE